MNSKENNFNKLSTNLFDKLQNEEQLEISLSGEESLFIRFNKGKVRQISNIEQGVINITLHFSKRTMEYSLPFSGDLSRDLQISETALLDLRSEIRKIDEDPYYIPLHQGESSHLEFNSELNNNEFISKMIVEGLDFGGYEFVGLLTSGNLFRAQSNSYGLKHWFSTQSFYVDYSLFGRDERAAKGNYFDKNFCKEKFQQQVNSTLVQIRLMERKSKKLARGRYRTYFAPEALQELIFMLSWNALSGKSLKEGSSALRPLYEGEKELSKLITLKEDFSLGLTPRFNKLGECAPSQITILADGKIQNPLVSSRTAKEFNLTSNMASENEMLRSPILSCGSLKEGDILKELDTGLYVSNLHYLNWSDDKHARVTGMTRYACFWVKNGQIVSPIENMRFDDSYYSFFGDNLVSLTNFQKVIPEVSTYYERATGGVKVPGMLVSNFNYTL